MIAKITNRRIVLFALLTAATAGLFTAFMRYDWVLGDPAFNNFIYIHDDDVETVGFHTVISIMNIILLFPFALELLTDHKATEIYIVSRMASSVRFYCIRFAQMLMLCFAESLCYNTALLAVYCCAGTIAEPTKQLAALYAYAVISGFLTALVFVAIMQLLAVVLSEKNTLIITVALFCVCVVISLKLADKAPNLLFTNNYFLTRVFAADNILPKQIICAVALPLAATGITVAVGSCIYKHTDHL